MKHLLFEDNGEFRAGTALSETASSLQVETASGKRVKVKVSNVLLRFDAPAPDALIPAARQLADSIELGFLWECAPQAEFDFGEMADEYWGHRSAAPEATAMLLKLHSAPVYFHRKGRGRFRAAPPEVLHSALATLERRRREQERIDAHAQAMQRGELPEEIAAQAAQLLVRPDRNSAAWKALERALSAQQSTPERLLCSLGAFESPRAMHVARFEAEHFPQGFGVALPGDSLAEARSAIDALPRAEVEAFSIDDSTTTEIDDCLSVHPLEGGGWRIGIHVAAPGVAIEHSGEVDLLARARMATVYLPGDKITMLPQPTIAAFSLDTGREVAVLSLYVEVDAGGEHIVSKTSRVERIVVAQNLRHDLLGNCFEQAALDSGAVIDHPRADAIRVLWRLTRALGAERERVRGKPEPRFGADFSFHIDREGEAEHVRIVQRQRDAPLDRIVSEAMILANSEWARLLSLAGVPGVFRSQQAGRVRTATHAAPHQGLGVAHYMWSTSPLRRYVDLVNQRQLLAVLAGRKPPLAANDTELFSILSAFEARYGAYLEFQQRMERYWCLRWIEQQRIRRAEAVVVRDDLVRLADAPLYFRLAAMPALGPGRRIVVDLLATDEIDLSVQARFVELAVEANGPNDLALGADGEAPLAEPAL